MLQCLEIADRHAELLARLQVLQSDFVQGRHDADRFGAERGIGVVERALDHRQRVAGCADQRVGADGDLGQLDVGGTSAVLCRIGAQRDAGGFGVDQEQGQPLAIPRRDDQLVRRRRTEHHGLGAIELPAAASGRGGGGDPVNFVAAAGLMVGQRQHQFAAGDGRQQCFLLRGTAGITDQAAAEHDGRYIGLQREAAAEHFHDQHGVDGRAVQSAEIFMKGQGEDAEIGKSFPRFAIETIGRFRQRTAVLEGVILGDETAQGVLQCELFFGVVEVHGQSPRIICEMMFFWISLEPP